MNLEIHKKILELLENEDFHSIQSTLKGLNPAEISNILIRFNDEEISQILSSMDANISSEIILELPEDIRTQILKVLDSKSILNEDLTRIYSDQRASRGTSIPGSLCVSISSR